MAAAKDNLDAYIEFGRSVLRREGEAVLGLAQGLGDAFGEVCSRIHACAGAVVVSGVGKAGLVGKKISATLASTGTRSLWLDPLNAMHGDLGMVSSDDVAILLSNSGTSDEILAVAQALGGLGVTRVAVTGAGRSALAGLCEYVLELGDIEEACPLRLAPSASTTAMLAMGDALALAVQSVQGFTEQDYARLHPSGALGRRLQLVRDLMRTGERMAVALPDTPVAEAVSGLTRVRCGACIVTDDGGRLLGVYTEGDFRRQWTSGKDLAKATLAESMTHPCKRVRHDELVGEAIELMRRSHINALPVVDENDVVVGLLDIQDVA